MRTVHRLSTALLTLALIFAATTAFAVTVTDIVNQVSQSNYTNYLNNQLYTHNGNNRGSGTANHDAARTNIYNAFQSFGLDTTLEWFDSNIGSNVVGVLPGTTHPDQVYIVGAHYDSAYNPGADDNASGVAGVMEAARVLSNYQFDATLVFIAFDREEQGLYGSWDYAGDHYLDNIQGMISMDMIAYNPAGSTHDQAYCYYAGATPSTTAIALQDAIAAYGGDITGVLDRLSSASSDHYPFYAYGFESALLIEREVWSNPYYHKSTDSVDMAGYIDYEYATNLTAAVVGYLATQAVAVPEPSSFVLLGIGTFGMFIYVRRRRG